MLLEDAPRNVDLGQRDVARQGVQRRERVQLAGGVALLHQLHGDLARHLRVGLEAALRDGHVGVGAQPVVVSAAQEIVDGLVGRLADDVPAGDLDGAQGGRGVEAGVAEVVARAVHALPDLLDAERVLPDDELAAHLLQQGYLRLHLLHGEVPAGAGEGVAGDALAQAHDALVRDQLHEEQVATAAVGRLVLNDHSPQLNDLHVMPPCWSVVRLCAFACPRWKALSSTCRQRARLDRCYVTMQARYRSRGAEGEIVSSGYCSTASKRSRNPKARAIFIVVASDGLPCSDSAL